MIFYSVNAGLCFREGGASIWVDGIHAGRSTGFSDMPDELHTEMIQNRGMFEDCSLYLFTHEHQDHYYEPLLRELLEVSPDSKILSLASNVFPGRIGRLDYMGWKIRSFRAIHDGEEYKDVPLSVILLGYGEREYFIASDAVLTVELAEKIREEANGKITAAFLNFYQMFSNEGKDALKILAPEKIYAYHLPLEEDDHNRIYRLTNIAVKRLRDKYDVSALIPMSVVSG